MKKVPRPGLYIILAYPCLIPVLVLLSIPTGRSARAGFSEQSPSQTTTPTAATKAGASTDAARSLAQAIAMTVTEQAKLTPPDGAASYFVLSGGTWGQQAKLLPDGGAGFIDAVSLSGNRALLGGRGITPANASYIFAYDGISWSQEAKLTSGVAYDQFGASVSLS